MDVATTNKYAALGVALQYSTLVRNETARELANTLLQSLQTTGKFNNVPVVDLVGRFTKGVNQTVASAEAILGGFAKLPYEEKHGVATPWFTIVSISGFLLFMRMLSRWKFSNGLQKDDYLLVAAWTFGLAEVSMVVAQVYHVGTPLHVWDTTLPQVRLHALLTLPEDICYLMSLATLKSSLLLFYYNLYPSRPLRRFVIVFGIVIWLYTIAGCLMSIFKCVPIDIWDHPLEAKCAKVYGAILSLALLNITSDVITLIIPMFVVYKVQMPKKTKLLLVALFGLGAVVCAASMYRLRTLKLYAESKDLTWASIPPALWSTLELQLGIICASIPPVRRLVIGITEKVRTSVRSPASAEDSDGEKELTEIPSASTKTSTEIAVTYEVDVSSESRQGAGYSTRV